jgi:hypothetical protein
MSAGIEEKPDITPGSRQTPTRVSAEMKENLILLQDQSGHCPEYFGKKTVCFWNWNENKQEFISKPMRDCKGKEGNCTLWNENKVILTVE